MPLLSQIMTLSIVQQHAIISLHWRHNDHDCVSSHQLHGCLLNRLSRCRSKKTSKLRVTGLCVGNSPGPVNSPHKGLVTRKMFPFDDVIIFTWISTGLFLTGTLVTNFNDIVKNCERFAHKKLYLKYRLQKGRYFVLALMRYRTVGLQVWYEGMGVSDYGCLIYVWYMNHATFGMDDAGSNHSP